MDGEATNLIVAGKRVYACKPGGVYAIDFPKGNRRAQVSWEREIDGVPRTLLAADEKLFVTTEQGRIYCFGGRKVKPTVHERTGAEAAEVADRQTAKAREILEVSGVREGYCLVWGAEEPDLLLALARQSQLRIVAVEPDETNVAAARTRLDEWPQFANRVAVMPGDPQSFGGPPYWASLVVCPSAFETDAPAAKALFHPLRPYGGVACAALDATQHNVFVNGVAEADLAQAEVARSGNWTLLTRPGALPGSADWTHQYADAANTVVSKDELVRAPLGLLWFGGSSNVDILPRHGHGPSEQVVDGRLFIEGPDSLRALDVYTGGVLWQVNLPDLGRPYNNTSHQPGANARGSNYVSVSDGIYVAHGQGCLRLDPATGETLDTFRLPVPEGTSGPPSWGYIGVWEDLLIAGSEPLVLDEPVLGHTWNSVASKRLVALHRYSGEALWSVKADIAFRHNAIALGAGKVFCIDRATDELVERMARRGLDVDPQSRLLALDIRTGNALWSTDENVFGTWLGYSAEHDILLQAGRASRDMLKDEPRDRMITYHADDGTVLWDQAVQYYAPCMLHGDTIIAQEQAFSLLTGERVMRKHPLTGADVPWQWTRNYGCNSAIASTHLVLFRSAAAGFFDLARDGGTGNLGGFKSGCTSNLIAANGVLNSPDYTRTCTCSYQNQTSLAFIHTPGVEMWTFNKFELGEAPIMRVGINLGAPGDRRADNGTLWLDYPSVGGPSPQVPVAVTPEDPAWFRRHSVRMRGDGLNWVAASGGKGIESVRVTLDGNAAAGRAYTVRLYFAEPEFNAAGQRVFDVALQGQTVIEGLDVAKEAGGTLRALEKEFSGIKVSGDLTVMLTSREGSPVLCGIEAVAE